MEIKQAMKRVNQDDYMKEDGKLLPQTTNPKAIEKGLHMLHATSPDGA